MQKLLGIFTLQLFHIFVMKEYFDKDSCDHYMIMQL